jgi:hypothetical protein
VKYKSFLALTDGPFFTMVYYHNGQYKAKNSSGLVLNDQTTMEKFKFLYQLFAVLILAAPGGGVLSETDVFLK